jgi:uncharacterized membrane protein YeaQ/YmgE (transglycosylase-associated protein family)
VRPFKCDRRTVGILSWIVLGAAVAWVATRIEPAGLAGGTWALCLVGMAGGFVAGGTVALVTGSDAASIDSVGAIVAAAGAALLVLIVRRAARVQPRTGRRTR